MARTTQAQVATIIDLDLARVPGEAEMAAFILPANLLVTEVCTGTDDGDPDPAYDSERLEIIERWLAAHFYTVADPRVAGEGAKGVTANYQSKVDLGFDTSHYGQTAMRLDTNGGLARINKDATEGASIMSGAWLGSTDHTDPDTTT